MSEKTKNPFITVIGARVCVLERKNTDKLESGIIIPGREKEPTFRGTVIKVGNGALLENGERVPMQVKVGDDVIYTNWSGSPIEVDGEIYTILNERDIICVLEDE